MPRESQERKKKKIERDWYLWWSHFLFRKLLFLRNFMTLPKTEISKKQNIYYTLCMFENKEDRTE